jgi:EAL domain-containing protein (putative c-di-GMP-specific phosphodiesterase class I)
MNDIENNRMREYILQKVNKTKDVKVTFELVESENIRESEFVRNYLMMLKKLGAEIYIDDFGSGYSNFDYLIKLSPEGIKIDGSLIKDILTNPQDELLVETIISFAKSINMKVVAEFVENEEIFEKLKELGVDYFQGYYFSPPKPDLGV